MPDRVEFCPDCLEKHAPLAKCASAGWDGKNARTTCACGAPTNDATLRQRGRFQIHGQCWDCYSHA